MDDQVHASPNPLGDAAATEDQVPLAGWSMAAAVGTAIACLGLVTWLTQWLGRDISATSVDQIDPNALHLNVLLYGTITSLFIAGWVAWLLMSPVASRWRRGALSMVAALAGLCAGMLLTFVAREVGGALALALISLLGTFVFGFSSRRAVRARNALT